MGGVDKYFTPFYRADNSKKFSFEKYLYFRQEINLVPQVLTNNPFELAKFSDAMKERGFDEINLNVGCPFPMVVNRKLGSGLLPYPDDLRRMLFSYYKNKGVLKLSVKLRSGFRESKELFPVLKVLRDFPLEEIILHPRLGIQKYKGSPDWDVFSDLARDYDLAGNGDINNLSRLEELRERFPQVKAWMIGRGLLRNPCMLKPEKDWKETVIKMHGFYRQYLSEFGLSEHQVLNRLKCFWEYPSQHLEGGQRMLRKMKKTGKMEEYLSLKERLLGLEVWKSSE